MTGLRSFVLNLALVATIVGNGAGQIIEFPGDMGGPQPYGSGIDPQQAVAASFLSQTTYGADLEMIDEVVALGPEAWIDAQMALPPSEHLPWVLYFGQSIGWGDGSGGFHFFYWRWSWWQNAMTAPDQLRQRVAYALSQIFVISDNVDQIGSLPAAPASYYDILVRNAFGNYRDLLGEVSFHPAMGVYLSHLHNRKSDPALGRFPDENFAREVMQLFSIGLFQLEADGSQRLDAEGQPIPTYGNAEITEMAKIFTGLGFEGATFDPEDGELRHQIDPTAPMVMFEEWHEQGPKTLLNGFVVPAGNNGMEDIEAAIDHLASHPNIGPFIGRRLIQRLVTSNPSPDYVSRVSAVWADNGLGERGDLGAVVRAILLDPEARRQRLNWKHRGGRLQEPLLRWTQLLRSFNASSESGLFLASGSSPQILLRQHPLSAPSVFNFYLPDHSPSGEIAASGLVAPEFQITNSATVVAMPNLVAGAIYGYQTMHVVLLDLWEPCEDPLDDRCERRQRIACLATASCPSWLLQPEQLEVGLDLEEEIAIAADLEAFITHLDLLLCHGRMSHATREQLRTSLAAVEEPYWRARFGIYLTMISPDAAVAG